MNKYFLVTILMLSATTACVNTQTKNITENSVPQTTPVQRMPPAQDYSRLRSGEINFAAAEKIQFAALPKEIIAHLAKYENRAEYVDKDGEMQSYPDSSPAWYKNRKVEVLAKDLNDDGALEKIVVCDDSADYDVAPTAYFFTFKDARWISLHSGGFSSPKTLKLFSSEKKGEFDIIGYGGERTGEGGKNIKFTGYWRVENGQYEQVDCRETVDEKETIIPCPK